MTIQQVNTTFTWKHAANEWADAATNGLQWLKNIRDGISTVDEALANLLANLEHCKAVDAGVKEIESKSVVGQTKNTIDLFTIKEVDKSTQMEKTFYYTTAMAPVTYAGQQYVPLSIFDTAKRLGVV